MASEARGQPSIVQAKDSRGRPVRCVFKVTRSDGTEYYRIDFRDQHHRRIREYAGLGLTEARALLEQRRHEVRTGTFETPRDRKLREEKARRKAEADRGPSVGEFVTRFLREHPGKRRSNHYVTSTRPLIAYFQERAIRDITRGDLDAFRVHLSTMRCARGRPYSPTTVVKALRTAGRVFKMAARWGVIENNPAADLPKPSPAKPRTRYLTKAEYTALETAAAPWLKPILRMAVSTGLRLKEVLLLGWGDVDKAAGMLHVSEDSKTGSRTVPMNATVRAILDGRVRHVRSPFVFVDGTGEDYASEKARHVVTVSTKKVMRKAGIADASFATLRHTFASWTIQDGASLYELQQILGHSTPAMTQRYATLQPGHLRRAVGAIDRVFGEMDTQTDTSAAAGASGEAAGERRLA